MSLCKNLLFTSFSSILSFLLTGLFFPHVKQGYFTEEYFVNSLLYVAMKVEMFVKDV